MGKTAPEISEEFLEPESPTPRNIFKQLDPSVYKQLLVFLGIAALLATGFYIYLRIGQEMTARNQTKTGEKQSVVEDAKSKETKSISSQDQQRKNNIVVLNSALKSYFLTNKKAPKTLSELVPNNLSQLPTDPKTKKEYSYTTSDDQQTWKVWAVLSSGNEFDVSGP